MKWSEKFFCLLLFFLPSQLSFHFWPQWAYVWGLRVDYLAPTLFLTDLLVFLVLITTKNLKFSKALLFVFLFLVINCLLAPNKGAAFYKLIKIIEFIFLGIAISKASYGLRVTHYALPLAVIYSCLIAIVQFIKQSSLNGIFWWLGERTFSLSTPGIAKLEISGQLFLRPYATFPHPNALAGFLLISLILTLPALLRKNKSWGVGYLFLTGLVIILTFSRSAWLGAGLLLGFIFGKKKFLFALIFAQEAVSQRLFLNQVALKLLKANPFLGGGLNNFIPQLSSYSVRFLQPVHNLFLLVAAETGLFGLLLFLIFLFFTFKKLIASGRRSLIISLAMILFLGLFDHYWLTLQQNQLLLTFILGLSWKK